MTIQPNPYSLTFDALRELAKPLAFALVGVAPAEASEHEPYIREWLAAGRQGEMHYLANNLDKRLDPQKLLAGARSIICVADRHADDTPPENREDQTVTGLSASGHIARYAWGEDYHKVIKKRLFRLVDALRERFPDQQFKAAVDTAPLLEREHAALAGLGWIGKHTLLIHPRFGSYLLLGEIVTTLTIETSENAGYPPATTPPADHCGTCTRCIDACPTGCIQPYQLDAQHCISYLTLEHRGVIDPSLHGPMGDWIAGCDVCQEVCPHNRRRDDDQAARKPPIHPAYAPPTTVQKLDLLQVLGWLAEDRRRAFTRSALKRMKLDMLKRNALIAAGNFLKQHDAPALHQRIRELAHDEHESPLVSLTAEQVLTCLDGKIKTGSKA